MPSDRLREAYQLIREGNKPQAVRILVPIVRAEPDNADAWWLLANAVEKDDQKERALRQVLKLRPGDEAAQRMLDRLVPPAAAAEDVFAEDLPADGEYDVGDQDLFADAEPQRVRVHKGRGGSSPLTIILALIGLMTVISCAACVLVLAVSAPTVTRVFEDILGTVTYEPAFATLSFMAATAGAPTPNATIAAPATLPADLQKRGSIHVGETKQETLAEFKDDSWTFSADAGEHVVIELYANDSALDPHLYLYDPTGALIADNDDIDNANNQNSRIDITLEQAGLYTIRVSKFSGGGLYALSLREG